MHRVANQQQWKKKSHSHTQNFLARTRTNDISEKNRETEPKKTVVVVNPVTVLKFLSLFMVIIEPSARLSGYDRRQPCSWNDLRLFSDLLRQMVLSFSLEHCVLRSKDDSATLSYADGVEVKLPRNVFHRSRLLHQTVSEARCESEVLLELPKGVVRAWMEGLRAVGINTSMPKDSVIPPASELCCDIQSTIKSLEVRFVSLLVLWLLVQKITRCLVYIYIAKNTAFRCLNRFSAEHREPQEYVHQFLQLLRAVARFSFSRAARKLVNG